MNESISLGGKKVFILFDRQRSLNLERASEQGEQRPDILTTLQSHITEFWRLISILPAVLGRNELITAFMGIAFELNLLTEVLIIGAGAVRDTGVKRLNPFIPPEVKSKIENALQMEGLAQESLARMHLRLASMMQRRGPAIAEKYEVLYP